MYTENELLIKEIVGAIRKFVRAVSLDAFTMGKQYNLTGPQSAILRTLVKDGPLPSASLSRRLYVTPANITGIVDRLVKRGLVKRVSKEGDRRIVLVALTESGEELSKSLPDPLEKRLICELADLETEHVRILALVMNQILNLMDAKGVDNAFLELHQDAKPQRNNSDHHES